MMMPIGTLGKFRDSGDFEVEVRIIGYITIGNLNLYVLYATDSEAENLNVNFEPCRPDLGYYYELMPEDDTSAFSLL